MTVFLVGFVRPSKEDHQPKSRHFLFSALANYFVYFFGVRATGAFPPDVSGDNGNVIKIRATKITNRFERYQRPIHPRLLNRRRVEISGVNLAFFVSRSAGQVNDAVNVPGPIINVRQATAIFVCLTVGDAVMFAIFTRVRQAFVAAMWKDVRGNLIIFASSACLCLTWDVIPFISSSPNSYACVV